MTPKTPGPEAEVPEPEEEPETFGDEGAGPEEPPEVIEDPENQAAAKAIRDSTLDDEEGPGEEKK